MAGIIEKTKELNDVSLAEVNRAATKIYNPNNGIQEKRTVFKSLEDSIGIAPIICYESVFGEYVTDYVRNGASILDNLHILCTWSDDIYFTC